MTKLLKALHLAVVFTLVLYMGKELARYVIKLVNPASDAVRFWHPGGELILAGLGLALLLGIACCSLSLIKGCPLPVRAGFHAGWLVCLTWIGWFSVDAPFRLHELVGFDLTNPATIDRIKNHHFVASLAIYALIALITSMPLLVRFSGTKGRRPDSRSTGPQGPALQPR